VDRANEEAVILGCWFGIDEEPRNHFKLFDNSTPGKPAAQRLNTEARGTWKWKNGLDPECSP
jgi:hypothetical protein